MYNCRACPLTASLCTRAMIHNYGLCLSKFYAYAFPSRLGKDVKIYFGACSVIDTQNKIKTKNEKQNQTILITWMMLANTLVWARGNQTAWFLFDSRELLCVLENDKEQGAYKQASVKAHMETEFMSFCNKSTRVRQIKSCPTVVADGRT